MEEQTLEFELLTCINMLNKNRNTSDFQYSPLSRPVGSKF